MAIIRWREGEVPGLWCGRARFFYDGDTVFVDGGPVRSIVRIWGIDAPERGQAGFGAARAALRRLVGGVPVYVYPVGLDRYGRVVARLATYQVPDVGLRLLTAGLVWWEYRFAPAEARYRDAQGAARAAGLGLWSSTTYGFAPWVFRRRRFVGA